MCDVTRRNVDIYKNPHQGGRSHGLVCLEPAVLRVEAIRMPICIREVGFGDVVGIDARIRDEHLERQVVGPNI